MRVLWFSNFLFSDAAYSTSGSWGIAMSEYLQKGFNIDIFNVTTQPGLSETRHETKQGVEQWVLPLEKLGKNGLPCDKTLAKIQEIVASVNPDIIHIWGTENYFGLLTARGYFKGRKVILDLQGLSKACYEAYYCGLTAWELVKCYRLKEIIAPSRSLFAVRRNFKKWIPLESEILAAHKYINAQSQWIADYIKPQVAPDAEIFRREMPVREEFLTGEPWHEAADGRIRLACISAWPLAHKGIHTLLKAVGTLKQQYPDIELTIFGNFDPKMNVLRQSGYMKFLLGLIRKYKLERNVVFPGPAGAKEIAQYLANGAIAVVPSYIETYCMALAEAQCVGAPCVIADAGALPELSGGSALKYQPSDPDACAVQIVKIVADKQLAKKMSEEGRALAHSRNAIETVLSYQLSTYREVNGGI